MAADRYLNPDPVVGAIQPSDTFRVVDLSATDATLDPLPKAIYVGTGGTIIVRGHKDATDVSFLNVPNGMILDIKPGIIRRAGTTASGIVALF